MATKPLAQQIDDWFRNSPDWPLQAIAVEDETDAFMIDGSEFAEDDVRREIQRFAAAARTPTI